MNRKADADTLCQGERIPDKEIDAFVLSVNNVYRIVEQQRSDITEAKRLLKMAIEASAKGENIDVGQINGFLERKW